MPSNPLAGSRGRALNALTPAAGFLLLLALHFRWVLTHFSSDGYLYDSGWLAYLFASGDPLIHNPSSINGLSFYAHHLSPHIFLFGAPLARLGLNGFQILALHQGLFFGLFFVGAWLLATAAPRDTPGRTLVMGSAILIGAAANALFQAAGYPHYEIALLSLTSLALAAWIRGEHRLFFFLLAWLPLVREDGGFYAAYLCLVCAILAFGHEPADRARAVRLAAMAAIAAAIAVVSVLAKPKLFPGFDAFAMNFSGHHWNHVTAGFVVERLRATAANPNIVPVLVGVAVLGACDVRYLLGFALMTPLYALYMVSVRPEHGHFTLYFALPWLLPPIVWIAVYVRRARSQPPARLEGLAILAVSLALAAPVQAAARVPGNSWYVAEWALRRRVVDLHAIQQFSRAALDVARRDAAARRRACASMGIAALVPNSLQPDEVVDGSRALANCEVVLLLNGDMSYGPLRARAEDDGFHRVLSRYTAELWQRQTK